MEARLLVLVLLGLCLSGCASRTTAILLPDEDGRVGSIVIVSNDEARVLDHAYQSVTSAPFAAHLSATQALSEEQVNRENAQLIKAQPSWPSRFTIYFPSGSAELTSEAQAIVPRILDRIRAQGLCEITIIGHADTTGPDSGNVALAGERARVVGKILKDGVGSPEGLRLKSFGSRKLVVPTPLNVDEPRNRQVEILVL